ncbi:hypothetical protein OCE25_28520 [Bacillus cereus]|nr:hypothetical protein [Bacillus cereus]
MAKIENVIFDCVMSLLNEGFVSWAQIKQIFVDTLGPFLFSEMDVTQ